jgi:AAA15 family ATPase/GTPase
MLLQFKFKNFKSFAEEVTLDMLATGIKEHSSSLIDVNGNLILPVAAIFGANASGKSNIFKAFNAMCDEVMGEFEKNEKHINIRSFIFDDKLSKEPTEFQVCVNIDDKEYRYGFLRNQTEVFEEWLFEKNFIKGTRSKEKCVYYRENMTIEPKTVNKKEQDEISFVFSMLSKNDLLLTLLGKRKKSKYAKLYEWFQSTARFQDFSDDYDEWASTQMAAEFLYDKEMLLKEVVSLLRAFDKSILSLIIEVEKDSDLNDSYQVYSYHSNSKKSKIKIPFSSESSGTQKIFSLATWLFFSINAGMVLFVDELDAKLHPLALRYLIRLFTDTKANTGKGQLIFSSHNLVCLDSSDLRRDEIWFVEKNNQYSTMFSLYDFKNDDDTIRSDVNFGKNYLSGRFGAIPFQDEEE